MCDSLRHLQFASILILVVTLLGSVGCDPDGRRIPKSWSALSLDDSPPLFEMRRGHPALSSLPEALFLGQSHERAMQALKQPCLNTVRLDSNTFGSEAFFVGCQLPDPEARPDPSDLPETVQSLRVGFWPKLDRHVATLEIKRDNVHPGVVWRRFKRLLPQETGFTQQRWTGSILMVSTPHYRLFADWDEGADGPTHITIGFDPDIDRSAIEQ